MATKTAATKTQATKTEAAKTAQAAKQTTQQAQRTRAQAERTARTFIADGAYAALGVGDTAVGVLKRLPTRVGRVGKKAPKTVEARVKGVERRVKSLWTETPDDLKTRLEAARTTAGKELDTYAQRGRSVVQAVTSNKATRRALDQTKVARGQVKAATTSVRKALGQSAEAVETAADKVGDEQRAG